MAKEKKPNTQKPKTVELSAEQKKEMKSKLKAFKSERDSAVGEHYKKKIKAARKKMKSLNLKLKRVKVKAEPAKEQPKEEAAG